MEMRHGVTVVLIVALVWASGPLHAQTTVEYIHTDALGTPIAITNASGAVIERSEYDPYGALLNRPLTDGPGFTGHVQDAASGLTYMQQRYYDPMLGVFLSVDPVTPLTTGGSVVNRYWYAGNNPFRFTDPDGRAPRGPQSDLCSTAGGPCDSIYIAGSSSHAGGRQLDESQTRDAYSDAGEDAIQELMDAAYEILAREPGPDGVVDISIGEFGQIMDYEVAQTRMRSELRGGFENLPAREVLREARYADSLFYGQYGGVKYRVTRPGQTPIGPYLGGDFNYIKQGMTFRASGDSTTEMHVVVRAWNYSGAGTAANLVQRLFFSDVGYIYYGLRNGE